MPKRLHSPVVRRHFLFFEEDLIFAEKQWGPKTPHGMSVSQIVRTTFHDAMKRARQKLVDQQDAASPQPYDPTKQEDLEF